MGTESGISPVASRLERVPPYSEEAERGALGSILIDAGRVMDLAVEQQLTASSFYVPAHRMLFEVLREMQGRGAAVDLLTVTEQLRASDILEKIGGASFLDRMVDSTPTAAHADYYIDLVRQKDVWLGYHGPGDAQPLFFPARQRWRHGPEPVAEADPLQELDDIGLIVLNLATCDPQGKRHIVKGV